VSCPGPDSAPARSGAGRVSERGDGNARPAEEELLPSDDAVLDHQRASDVTAPAAPPVVAVDTPARTRRVGDDRRVEFAFGAWFEFECHAAMLAMARLTRGDARAGGIHGCPAPRTSPLATVTRILPRAKDTCLIP